MINVAVPENTQVGADVRVIARTLFPIAAFSGQALAQFSSPEAGRWYTAKPGVPEQIEIYFAQCGDTQDSETRMDVKVHESLDSKPSASEWAEYRRRCAGVRPDELAIWLKKWHERSGLRSAV